MLSPYATQLVKVLSDQAALKHVEFTFLGTEVHAANFAAVADHIRMGSIKVDTMQGGGAAYEFGTDTFWVPSEMASDLHRRALLVHEAVHAINDMLTGFMIDLHNEAGSYLAQALYLISNGTPADDVDNSTVGPARFAFDLAKKYLAYKAKKGAGAPDLIFPDETKLLLKQIPMYRNTRGEQPYKGTAGTSSQLDGIGGFGGFGSGGFF